MKKTWNGYMRTELYKQKDIIAVNKNAAVNCTVRRTFSAPNVWQITAAIFLWWDGLRLCRQFIFQGI